VARGLTAVKQLSIALGLYRPARWLLRAVRRSEQKSLLADVELYRSLLPPRALCFDVGANIGEKSEALLRSGARVVAFEPNRLVLPELRARCGSNRAWTLVETALGSASGIAILHAQRSHGKSSLADDWEEGQIIANFPVPIVTLDAAIACFGLPDYCKIDVEGWELEVLNGLSQPIKLISFEFHLGEKDVRYARSCLERLTRFGPSELNITPAETSTFLFEKWIPVDAFLSQFPGNVIKSLPGNLYGDIVVRSLTN
jgi:FkbM family methyltransferase